jgi:hypothetical protein
MATISPPKKKTKGAPPPETRASDNLDKESKAEAVGLNFKVPPEFKKEFKGYALDVDMTMSDLLHQCFAFYKEHHK